MTSVVFFFVSFHTKKELPWTFSTYDGQNCHRIHLSNFLKQGIRVQLLIRINNKLKKTQILSTCDSDGIR